MMSHMPLITVLFVCTGNICRSPTAEGVFRDRVMKAGWQDRFLIDSAGTGGWHIGNGPDPRSVATALARGVDIAPLRARQLQIGDYDKFQHLIALDETHFDHMMKLKPQASGAQISLLMNYEPAGEWRDVPDPYYGGQKDFDLAYELIARGVDGLLAVLMKDKNI